MPAPRFPDPHRRQVARADRRWFLITFGVFALSVGLIFGARALYRWTGPHPGMTLFFRRLRRWARWIIPRHRRHRKWWW